MSATSTRKSFLRRTLEAISLSMCKLNRIQFDAPWRPDEVRRC